MTSFMQKSCVFSEHSSSHHHHPHAFHEDRASSFHQNTSTRRRILTRKHQTDLPLAPVPSNHAILSVLIHIMFKRFYIPLPPEHVFQAHSGDEAAPETRLQRRQKLPMATMQQDQEEDGSPQSPDRRTTTASDGRTGTASPQTGGSTPTDGEPQPQPSRRTGEPSASPAHRESTHWFRFSPLNISVQVSPVVKFACEQAGLTPPPTHTLTKATMWKKVGESEPDEGPASAQNQRLTLPEWVMSLQFLLLLLFLLRPLDSNSPAGPAART